jgi:ammonia channel protein AmtB
LFTVFLGRIITMDRNSQLFSSCYRTYREQTNEVLLCIANGIESRFENEYINKKHWFLIICSAMVFMMQLGFAMLSAGCVRRKNISNTLLKNLLDAAFAAIFWFAIGFPFAFGGDNPETGATFVGTSNFFLTGYNNYAFFLYEYCCSASANTIIAGTLAERCRMAAYISYCIFMISFCYPVVAHALWSENGFLSPHLINPFLGVGCIDFAGSGVVHLTGGATALIACNILGSRKGRFYDTLGEPLLQPKEIPGHSISLQAMGTLSLWFSCKCWKPAGQCGRYSSRSPTHLNQWTCSQGTGSTPGARCFYQVKGAPGAFTGTSLP